MPNCPAWLTARPIAHRGLHDAAFGLVENTLPAFQAAIERGFAIELDVQLTRDGQAAVFHDHVLDRLTGQTGPVVERDMEGLAQIVVTGSGARIASLAHVLAQVDGRTPLIIELKSRFDGQQLALADAVDGALAGYQGPAAVMSFDPVMIARMRALGSRRPLGMIAARMGWPHWMELSPFQRFTLGALLNGPALRADFISYEQASLPALAPLLARWLGRKKLITWTVRQSVQASRLRRWVDQITFEGFDPYGLNPGSRTAADG